MSLNNVIFVDSLKKLDLHGYDRETARVLINDFIKENYMLKNNIFVIVHGIGEGVLKEITHKTLKNNKMVIDYKLVFNNIGSTIVEINIK